MKLYPLIYTVIYTEAARTAKEALDKGVAALHIETKSPLPEYYSSARVILFDTGRASDAINKINEYDDIDIMHSLANRAIVGTVAFALVQEDLYKVSTSAGVSKFGPLTYQLVMASIKPAWLKSDDSLTEGEESSSNVWNKMYSMPESYERKWIGDFDQNLVVKAMNVNDSTTKLFKTFLDSKKEISEKEIAKFLANKKKSLAYFGHFYAYRIKKPEAKIKSMFKLGQDFLNAMQKQGFDQEEVKELIRDGAMVFFERRYSA